MFSQQVREAERAPVPALEGGDRRDSRRGPGCAVASEAPRQVQVPVFEVSFFQSQHSHVIFHLNMWGQDFLDPKHL